MGRPRVVDVSRYRGLFIVAVSLLTVFCAINLLLEVVAGADPAWLHPAEQPIDWGVHETAGKVVAGIERLRHRGQLSQQTHLGIAVGMSTTAHGFAPRILEEQSGVAERWVVISAYGMTFQGLEGVTRPLFFSDVQPAVVLLGVHPQMLVGQTYLPPDPPPEQLEELVRFLRIGQWWDVAMIPLRRLHLNWVLDNQLLISYHLRFRLYDARLCLSSLNRLSAEALFAPSNDPWKEHARSFEGAGAEDFAQVQIDRWTKRGYFQAKNYDAKGSQAASLARMVEGYRRLGAEVYIVLMPERSSLRSRIPPEAKQTLVTALSSRFPADPPRILDFQKVMADEYFGDHAHLTPEGSQQFTALVAQRLQRLSKSESSGASDCVCSP